MNNKVSIFIHLLFKVATLGSCLATFNKENMKTFFFSHLLVIDTRRRRSKKSRQMNVERAEASRDRFMRLIPEGWRRFNETQAGEKLVQKDSFEVKLEFFLRSTLRPQPSASSRFFLTHIHWN